MLFLVVLVGHPHHSHYATHHHPWVPHGFPHRDPAWFPHLPQITPRSFPGLSQAIPRSFPDLGQPPTYSQLIPNLFPDHSQITPRSFPGHSQIWGKPNGDHVFQIPSKQNAALFFTFFFGSLLCTFKFFFLICFGSPDDAQTLFFFKSWFHFLRCTVGHILSHRNSKPVGHQ